MVFLNNDFYTASGSVKLYNSWTDKVTKFDTSAFYNWEQDNLPIYDLEERTYHLWEQLGHPTSSLPGVVLVVSGGASPEYYEVYRNNFETVSAAIAALPQVLNYPVIIEICNKGNLGEINLKNIKCGPKGSLEIVNKAFAKQEPEFNGSSLNNVGKLNQAYLAISAVSGVDSSLTYSVPFTARKHFQNSISEFLNTSVFAGTNIGVSLFGMVCPAGEGKFVKATYFISSTDADTISLNSIKITPFETTTDATDNHLVNSYDFSGTDTVVGQNYVTTGSPETATLTKFIGLFYANKLTKVVVTNCDGPIYLRNLFVDDNNITTKNKYGIEVTNSRDVFLENCIASRHEKAGFFINNSKVIITRGIGAYRNYSTTPARVSNDINDLDIFKESRDTAAGLYALNSEIEFSSTASFERSLFEKDVIFSAVSSNGSLSYGLNYPLNFSRNANGIILENSKFRGGIAGASGTNLVCEFNNRCGLRLINSTFEWDGRVRSRQNNIGLFSVNSNLVLDRASFLENTLKGLLLHNSHVLYNKNSVKATGPDEYQIYFNNNGKHLNLVNSIYSYIDNDSIPQILGIHKFLNCYSKSILVEDSSKCVLVHANIRSKNQLEKNVKYGDPISVENNSKLVLKGSSYAANVIAGRPTEANQKNTAGIYVVNNSTTDIQGPTVLFQHAVNILAENNSVVNITPHREELGNLQINSFDLSDSGNHTMVELHSTKSCLVANNNSVFNIQDLGSYNLIWADSPQGSSVLNNHSLDYNVSEFEQYVSGGFLQFYPNPPVSSINVNLSLPDNHEFQGTEGNYYYIKDRNVNPEEFSSVTYGGMCVRAINDSVINVKNVNFPAGHWNPSGVFYNATDSISKFCSLLFMWNLADSSKLNASYCSVKNLFPPDAGYHGPPAVWLANLNINGILSGSPVSAQGLWFGDPFVSSYALLDYYGSGPAAASSIFTTSSLNQGVFRLFFSVDPASNHLTILTLTTPGFDPLPNVYFSGGWIPQVFAQGYYPPGYMSATDVTLSSTFKTLLRHTTSLANRYIWVSGLYRGVGFNGEGTNAGFFDTVLGAGMMQDPWSTRVFLDESAANTFANAKHCATGKSGAPKVVSIYYPYGDGEGEANYNNKNVGNGMGSVNIFDLSRNI